MIKLKSITSIVGLIVITVLILFSTSCNKDLDNLDIQSDAEFALPLFFGRLSIEDLIKRGADSSALSIDSEGNMIFHYSGDIVSRMSNEVFATIPTIPALITDTLFSVPIKLQNNIKLKKATLTDGTVFFTYKSYHTQDVTVEITIPELKKDGKSWSITRYVNYTGNVPVTDFIFPQFLGGWKLDLPGDSLHIRYKAIKEDGKRDTLSEFAMLVQNLKFSYVEGYFGYEEFPVKRDTIELNIYKNLLGGELYFDDPRVRISLINSFGFPLRAKVNIAKFRGKNGQLYDLESPFVTNGFDFNYPKLNEVGKTVTTVFDFDKNNSNIEEIINSSPIYLDYQIDAVANPDSDPNNIGFMTDSSKFIVNVSVDLPVKGRAKDFKIEDEFEVNFGKLDGFKEAQFKLVAENTLPVDMELQMYFVDANGTVMDSLFTSERLLVESAPVDGNGEVNGVKKVESFIDVTETQLNAIRNSKKVLMKAFLTSSNNGTVGVNIKSSQGLDVKMGVKAKIKSKL